MVSTADFAIGASVSEKRAIQEAVILNLTQASHYSGIKVMLLTVL